MTDTVEHFQTALLSPELEARVPYVAEAMKKLGAAELPQIMDLAAQLDPTPPVLSPPQKLKTILKIHRPSLPETPRRYLPERATRTLIQAMVDGNVAVRSSSIDYGETQHQGYGKKPLEDGYFYRLVV